jgi:formylglycine-generating enzyme
METEDGRSDPYEGSALAAALADHGVPRLVFLNICDGARGSCGHRSAGLAQSLVRHQVPAVVAMREQISDDAALVLARSFYERLAAAAPVDAALSRARREMQSARFWSEWGTPVLYMRADDGTLVPDPPPPVRRGRRLLLAGALLAVATLAVFGLRSVWDRAPEGKPQPELPARLRPPVASDPRCPSPPGLGLSFAYIGKGTYRQGEGRSARQVTITQPFCMGRYEVTEGEWNAVMGDGTRRLIAGLEDRLPARGKSWDDAVSFVTRLNETFRGQGFRLPTDAEWEYAARAKSETRYSFGDDVDLLRRYGNCQGDEDAYLEVAPVGVFLPNGWNLYDMQGNVSEWVQDAVGDPAGPQAGAKRIRRGGSWDIKAGNCGVGKRTSAVPNRRERDVGFRLVRDPVPSRP